VYIVYEQKKAMLKTGDKVDLQLLAEAYALVAGSYVPEIME